MNDTSKIDKVMSIQSVNDVYKQLEDGEVKDAMLFLIKQLVEKNDKIIEQTEELIKKNDIIINLTK